MSDHRTPPLDDARRPGERRARGERQKSEDRSGKTATIAAFLANVGVAAAKLVAFFFTGSASMLAEAMHSIADTGNQGLLLWGRRRAGRNPTVAHPFGFGRERYFWAFVVAIVLFTAGSLFSLVEGEEKLRNPHELTSYPWAAAVLVAAFVMESLSLRTAYRESARHKRADESWIGFIRRTKAPELPVVLLEDSGALTGLVLAFVGVTLAELTGNARFDATGSIGIGLLLGLIAFTLAAEMKSLLIGESAEPEQRRTIRAALDGDPAIARLVDLRTEHLGPEELLVVAAVEMDDGHTERAAPALAAAEERLRAQVREACLVYLQPVPPSSKRGARSDRSGGESPAGPEWDRGG